MGAILSSQQSILLSASSDQHQVLGREQGHGYSGFTIPLHLGPGLRLKLHWGQKDSQASECDLVTQSLEGPPRGHIWGYNFVCVSL